MCGMLYKINLKVQKMSITLKICQCVKKYMNLKISPSPRGMDKSYNKNVCVCVCCFFSISTQNLTINLLYKKLYQYHYQNYNINKSEEFLFHGKYFKKVNIPR